MYMGARVVFRSCVLLAALLTVPLSLADASAEDDGDASEQVDVAGSTQEETSERKAAESGGAGEFVPLATDGLKHVSSPQD